MEATWQGRSAPPQPGSTSYHPKWAYQQQADCNRCTAGDGVFWIGPLSTAFWSTHHIYRGCCWKKALKMSRDWDSKSKREMMGLNWLLAYWTNLFRVKRDCSVELQRRGQLSLKTSRKTVGKHNKKLEFHRIQLLQYRNCLSRLKGLWTFSSVLGLVWKVF